jgi:gas vesicle protein
LPPELRKHRLQKRLDEEVETLVTRNVENIRWATLRNLDDAFRRFSSNLEEQLKETADAIRDAMRTARVQREENKDAVQAELKRLEQKAAELTSLENSFTQFADSL